MSTVTDIILTMGCHDLDVAKVNALLEPTVGENQLLYQVAKPAGSPGKVIQADIYIGAFNHLDLGEVVVCLQGLPLNDYERESVRLFVQEEHDEHGFHEVRIWP